MGREEEEEEVEEEEEEEEEGGGWGEPATVLCLTPGLRDGEEEGGRQRLQAPGQAQEAEEGPSPPPPQPPLPPLLLPPSLPGLRGHRRGTDTQQVTPAWLALPSRIFLHTLPADPFPRFRLPVAPGLAAFPRPSSFHLPHLGWSPAGRAAVSCSLTPFPSPDSLCVPGLPAAPFGALSRCFSWLCFPSDLSPGALRKEGVPVLFSLPQFPAPQLWPPFSSSSL